MKYHYVYRITNKKENKHYYGVRSSKVEPKLDLGIKYFSSSKDKDFMNEQKINNSIFKYKVIKIFETREEAINLEIKLHYKFDVGKNIKFYNKSKQSSSKFDTTGVSQNNKIFGKATYINENGEKVYISVKEALLKGYVAESKGRRYSAEINKSKGRVGCNNHRFGTHLSNETKEKIKSSWFECRKKIICNKCKQEILKHHRRFHFENCKKEKHEN